MSYYSSEATVRKPTYRTENSHKNALARGAAPANQNKRGGEAKKRCGAGQITEGGYSMIAWKLN